MKTGRERKRYWDGKYYEYWKSRVEEAGGGSDASRVVAGDAKTEDDAVYEAVFREVPFRAGTLLEVGCAWGRMFPVYKRLGLEVHGVDISTAMIEAARKTFGGDPRIASIRESEAESLPFGDAVFDNVACLATFDATFQKDALGEFLRVLKPGGRLYLTGKNDDYPDDDRRALDAEIGARSKGHPNFFTDVRNMISQLEARGHRVIASRYYPRRGDFGRAAHETEMPEKFYEWFLVLEKGAGDAGFTEFADARSKTFRRSEGRRP